MHCSVICRQPHKARLIFVMPPDKYDKFKQQKLAGKPASQRGDEGGGSSDSGSSGGGCGTRAPDDGASSNTSAGVAGLASVTQYALCLSLDQQDNGGTGRRGSSGGASSSSSTRVLPGWPSPPGATRSYRATGGSLQPTAFPSLRLLPRQPRSMPRPAVAHASHSHPGRLQPWRML